MAKINFDLDRKTTFTTGLKFKLPNDVVWEEDYTLYFTIKSDDNPETTEYIMQKEFDLPLNTLNEYLLAFELTNEDTDIPESAIYYCDLMMIGKTSGQAKSWYKGTLSVSNTITDRRDA